MYSLILRSCFPLRTILNCEKKIFVHKMGYPLRLCSSSKDSDFETIYNLPYIKIIAPMCTLPKYAIPIGGITFPVVYALEFWVEMLPANSSICVGIGGALFTTITLTFGLFFQNTIGFIYASYDKKTLKVSYTDRWGSRIDKKIPVENWVPLSEVTARPTDRLYITTEQYDSSERLKLFYKQGQVLDKKVAEETIGSPY